MPTAFASRHWDEEDTLEGDIGELDGNRSWYSGAEPTGQPKNGNCGTPKEWEFGVPFPPVAPLTYPNSTVSICCDPPQFSFNGGIAWGGFPINPACCFGEDRPFRMFATYLGNDGGCTDHSMVIGRPIPLTTWTQACPVFPNTPVIYRSPPITVASFNYRLWYICPRSTANTPRLSFLGVNCESNTTIGWETLGNKCSPYLGDWKIQTAFVTSPLCTASKFRFMMYGP